MIDICTRATGSVECVCLALYLRASISSDYNSVMIAENVSVGILALPSAVATLGMVPYVRNFP